MRANSWVGAAVVAGSTVRVAADRRGDGRAAEPAEALGAVLTDCSEAATAERRDPAQRLRALDRNGNRDLSETMVFVMLPGDAFVGAEEGRRRTRYALLAGLQAQGLAPDDAEHFGLLQFALPTAGAGNRGLRVPYELLSQQPILRGEAGPDSKTEVYAQAAVLWVDETALPQPKLDALAALLGGLMTTPEGWLRGAKPGLASGVQQAMRANLPALAVIGPSTSDGLRIALVDLDNAANKCPPAPLTNVDDDTNDGAISDGQAPAGPDPSCNGLPKTPGWPIRKGCPDAWWQATSAWPNRC